MRMTLLSTTAILAVTLAGCGDDTSKTTSPPKTSNTTRVMTSDPPQKDAPAQPVAADNSARNARDAGGSTRTPLEQGTSERDIAITTAVRKAVVAHKGMSINGQNVKIIANDGVVFLRGPVETESERTAIVAMAEQVPEVKSVVNELEIASR